MIPSTHGGNGQGPDGRFLRGNKLARGNPLAGRAAKIRAVLLDKLTPEDAGAIVERIIADAKNGDLAAARELFDRAIGKPAPADLLERIERLEDALNERSAHDNP